MSVVTALALVPAAHQVRAAGPVPTQWIAKQYTELLGRAPSASEWASGIDRYAGDCTPATLAALGRELATSGEFASDYSDQSALDQAMRFTALVRAAFEHDPTTGDWDSLLAPYLSGATTWSALVDRVFADASFGSTTAPKACSAGEPSSGFAYAAPLDLRSRTGAGSSRTQQELQAAIDTQAGAGGGTVALQPGEVVRIGVAANQQLVIKAGVTLTTSGAPAPTQYARMGRLVPAGPGAFVCSGFLCFNVGIVRLEPGATLRNVWVDGQGMAASPTQMASIETRGSSAAAPTSVLDNRVSSPGRDGAGIRARGFSVTGTDCTNETIRGNLVTGYTSQHTLDRLAQPLWSDGIAVHCEATTVENNTIVDATDAAIMLHGSYNRELDTGRAQRSVVAGNTVISAGLDAHVAIGADPAGECLGFQRPLIVPCIDLPATRSFDGTTIRDNSFWTGPRTHFDVGLLIGGAPLWGEHRVPGTGATVTGNTTAVSGTRVNIGISVLGMANATVSGNASAYTLVDGNPASTWGKCPQVQVGVGSAELATLRPGAQASIVHDSADGCIIDGAPPGGLERLAVSPDGRNLVGASSGRRFTPWGMRADQQSFENWDTDWNRVVDAFRDIRRMGANTVRIMLNLEKFVDPPPTPPPPSTTTASTTTPPTTAAPTSSTELPTSSTEPPTSSTEPPTSSTEPPTSSTELPTSSTEPPTSSTEPPTTTTTPPANPYGTPNAHALSRLTDLVALAEQTGLYVELTGLGIEATADTGTWYDLLDEQARWAAQQVFWSAVADALKGSSAVAWYDLMNEPVAPGEPRTLWCAGRWILCWTQNLTKDPGARTKVEIARQWMTLMKEAVRTQAGDGQHLISTGLLPYGFSGFRPADVADLEDFGAVHMYPHADDPTTSQNELQRDINDVKASKAPGEPLVVDETFVLWASAPDVMTFILSAQPEAAGFIGHYFEKTPAELTPPAGDSEAVFRAFYQLFIALTPTVLDPITAGGGIPASPPTTTTTSTTTTTTTTPTTTPQVVPGSVTVTEGNTGTKVALVPVSLSASSSQTVTASWTTQNHQATAPQDFIAATGTVTFSPGQTSKTVGVTIKGDLLDEPNEVLRVQFSNPQNATIGGFGGLGQATITDDDPAPVIVPRAASLVEGNSSTKVLRVPVTLSVPSGKTVTASWTTRNEQAIAPQDFVAASGTVTFSPGQTSKTVGVTIKGDTLREANERFLVAFTNPKNATIGGFAGLGSGTIVNDD